MNSRSEMRRLAVQNPDALIEEIERLGAENGTLQDRLANVAETIEQLRAEVRKLTYQLDMGKDDIRRGAVLAADNDRLRDLLRSFRDDYDCDKDAHAYGTKCRACAARAAPKGKP